MAAFDDNSDMGPIVTTVVIGTLVAGALLYTFHRYEGVRTAFLNLPTIERSVPSIVPDQPQI
jgi:hypothetical protein